MSFKDCKILMLCIFNLSHLKFIETQIYRVREFCYFKVQARKEIYTRLTMITFMWKEKGY